MNRLYILHVIPWFACLTILLLFVNLNPITAEDVVTEDSYAAFVVDSTSNAINAASERLREVEDARMVFRGSEQQILINEDDDMVERPAGFSQERHQVDSRETMRAALLSVYDLNRNGILDSDELACIRNDRILVTKPSRAIDRWRYIEERMSTNKIITEEERERIIESIHQRISEEEMKLKEGRGK